MRRGPFPIPKEHPRASRENVLPKGDYSVDMQPLKIFPGNMQKIMMQKAAKTFKSHRASWRGIFKTT